MKALFKQDGNWYKGNLHMHTTLSDGKITPEEACDIYCGKGYDFIAMTDHRKPSGAGVYKNMLLIPGAEWDYGNGREYPVYHILAIGTESDMELPDFYKEGNLPVGNVLTPQNIIDRINAAGGLAILAHPAWSLMEPGEMLNMEGIVAAEVYNSVSGAPWNANRADSSHYFDLWASKGKLVPCVASDDSHWYAGEQTRAFTMVQAEELTVEGIMEALKNGRFYASCGPRFSQISYDEKQVVIECSEDVKRIIVYSNSVWVNQRVFDNPRGKAVYHIPDTDRYVRIELIDEDGQKAWRSPFRVK